MALVAGDGEEGSLDSYIGIPESGSRRRDRDKEMDDGSVL